jgi:glycosyltransferase involved in cell wall biosynthesis
MCELLDRSRRTIDFPPAEILFNGVDLTMFTQPENKVYGKSIGVIGWINYKKSPPLALQCFEPLAKHGYQMYFIGESQDLRYDLYLNQMRAEMGLEDKVHFLGKIPWKNVPNFCRNMDYLAHFAPFESFGQALMEAIACGTLPLIHRTMGIARRFGENMTWATVAEFEQLMRTYANIDDKVAVADANRRAVEAKYSFHDQLTVLDGIMADIDRELALSGTKRHQVCTGGAA